MLPVCRAPVRQGLYAAMLVMLAASIAAAQPGTSPRCYYTDAAGITVVALPGGFQAKLRRLAGDDVETACTVQLVDRRGRDIFHGEGFGTEVFRGETRDLDADGVPEVIIGVDSGGGNRCCWEYTVVRLGPRPRPLVDLGFAPWLRDDPSGQPVLVEYAPFYGLLGTSMAESPTITRVHRLVNGRLTEITDSYCPLLLSPTGTGWTSRGDEWAQVTPATAAASRTALDANVDARATRAAATSLALQLEYCGRAADAAAMVRDVWPADRVDEVLSAVKNAAGSLTRRQP